MMTFETWFSAQFPKIPQPSAQSVLKLVADGATVPFIARYRKEQTGNLDEVAIQEVIEAKENWDELLQRQTFITAEIERQGKLTPELKEQISSTFEMNRLEDLYLPYKQKKRTKAAIAKDAGLKPLADWMWNCGHGTEKPEQGQTLDIWAFTYRNEKMGINDEKAAIAGAMDIIIERLSEMQDLRQLVRTEMFEKGFLISSSGKKAKEHSKFENYFNYREAIKSLMQPQNSHRYLAVRRGWNENELSLNFGGSADDTTFEARITEPFERAACTVSDFSGAPALLKCAHSALKEHVLPSIENEVHKALKQVADEAAIKVFSENVRKLLLTAPLGAKAVLGIDPGIRTGCKVVYINDSGKYLANTVIHLQTDEAKKAASESLLKVIQEMKVDAIAIGNGTAGRETELFVRTLLKEKGIEIPVVLVNEAGASVYSASEVAREEFPELDVTVRGAISIGRRLQDPLAELVKIEPKSIGVGQYQHDVSQTRLKRCLDQVVDSCVNAVGVHLNTASHHLLAHVSGIGPGLAKSIVEHRGQKGLFQNRQQLLDVSRFSTKAFEQAAGFLRLTESAHPLDNTGVHPERYVAIEEAAKRLNMGLQDLLGEGAQALRKDETLKQEVGAFTFEDIIKELERPGRDPRDEFTPFQFRDDIHEIKDLAQGMVCPGIVTNVTNFGAFVDIGVHQDGLVHLSQLSERFIKDPREIVNPGDMVTVKVLEVNLEKKQISLSMRGVRPIRKERPAPRKPRPQVVDPNVPAPKIVPASELPPEEPPPPPPKHDHQKKRPMVHPLIAAKMRAGKIPQTPQGPASGVRGSAGSGVSQGQAKGSGSGDRGRPSMDRGASRGDRRPPRNDRGGHKGPRRDSPKQREATPFTHNPFAVLASLQGSSDDSEKKK